MKGDDVTHRHTGTVHVNKTTHTHLEAHIKYLPAFYTVTVCKLC